MFLSDGNFILFMFLPDGNLLEIMETMFHRSDEEPTLETLDRFPFIRSLPTFSILIFISALPTQHTTFTGS